ASSAAAAKAGARQNLMGPSAAVRDEGTDARRSEKPAQPAAQRHPKQLCDNPPLFSRRQQVLMAVTAPRALQDPPEQLAAAITKATAWLDRDQRPEGYWVGMLESSYCMEAEWLLAMHFLGVRHPREADLVATLLNAQRADGSWESYYAATNGD